MIECVFTLDYEIYGNGTGTLKDLVYEPAERLRDIFRNWNARFVAFVEVSEIEKIETCGADMAIGLVKRQIQDLHRDGFELGLHLHPQWCNACYDQGQWRLDYSEYNLCTLPPARIAQIVERSLHYLRHVIDQPHFTPLSFRAGNWLFQPTQTTARVLAEWGIRIDSSVFKGGLQHNHNLDYRPALRNGYYWPFKCDVNKADPIGPWIEVPIHTEMVPFWRLPISKRIGLRNNFGIASQSTRKKLNRALDFLRFRYPLKLDFCRMTLNELTSTVSRLIREDREEPALYRPVVAIGHTKDLTDAQTVDAFLSFLRANGLAVSTFEDVYPKLLQERADRAVGDTKHEPEIRSYSMASASADRGAGGATSLRYVLVTPARDEARFIELTIKSLVAQTVLPLKWVIVSDGSTDGTDDIVSKYVAKHSWIELLRMPERRERHFAGKVHAFNAGYSRVRDLDYDVIGNLDGDVTFDEGYFDFLLRKFAENPQLGVAGTPFREGSFQYDYRFTSIEHVSGQIQLFRRGCFEEIGGYIPRKIGGIDLVAVITARMKSWQTRTFPGKIFVHHRGMGTAKQNTLMVALKGGRSDYMLGGHPIWEVVRCIYQMTRSRFGLAGVLRIAGFTWAMVTGVEKAVPPDLVRFRRAEQMRRLRNLAKRWITPPFSKPKAI